MGRLSSLVIVLLAFTSAAAAPADRPTGVLARECSEGYFFSCAQLGIRYRYGRDAARDPDLAFVYLYKACDGGLAFACGYAGEMLYDGFQGRQDRARGMAMMRSACEGGDGWSCAALRRRGARIDFLGPVLRD
jgi:hypothetical protein